MRQDLSLDAETKSFLSLEKSIELTDSKCPSKSYNLFDDLKSGVVNSYTLTIQSSPPVASNLLSLENLHVLMHGSTALKSDMNS
jgi:hypothetical protein